MMRINFPRAWILMFFILVQGKEHYINLKSINNVSLFVIDLADKMYWHHNDRVDISDYV